MRCAVWLAAGLALALQAPGLAETRWVEAEGSATVSEQTAPDQAKGLALKRARARAVEQVTGLRLRDEAFQVRLGQEPLRLFRETHMVAGGHVVEEAVLGWKAGLLPGGANEPPVIRYTVQIRARVQTEAAATAPFSVRLALPRASLIAGEALTMRVYVSQPVHLHVFNLAADERVYPIYPNAYVRTLRADPGAAVTLPAAGSAFALRPMVLPGHMHDLEAIKVVATKDPLLLPDKSALTLAEFYQWLLAIPPEGRAEATAEYTVHRAAP
jgi:hypothetical protein